MHSLAIFFNFSVFLFVSSSPITQKRGINKPSIGDNNFFKYSSPVLKYDNEVNLRWKTTNASTFLSVNKKTPVVCVHGFGGNADQFRKNMQALAGTHPVTSILLEYLLTSYYCHCVLHILCV